MKTCRNQRIGHARGHRENWRPRRSGAMLRRNGGDSSLMPVAFPSNEYVASSPLAGNRVTDNHDSISGLAPGLIVKDSARLVGGGGGRTTPFYPRVARAR